MQFLSFYMSSLKNFIKKKITNKKNYEIKILYIRAIIHLIRYFIFSDYRKNRCFIDPPSEFFYKYKEIAKYFSIPLTFFAQYLKKKKIFISINNSFNFSVGHVYLEIRLLQIMQRVDKKYSDSTVWFISTRREILGSTKEIFENKNFKILFGGLKRIFLTFVAINNPSISIDGNASTTNFLIGKNNSHRIVFNNLANKRKRLISINEGFYPFKDKLTSYYLETNKLMQKLNITKKYVVIQIKIIKINGTLEYLNPDLLLKTIKYFQSKDYQIIFAGREKFPYVFLNKQIIDYANSKYASALNDYLIIGNCSLVISSGSGFQEIAKSLDKPTLVVNTHHISQIFGRNVIMLPTLLSRRSKAFNAKIQHLYLCTYGTKCGFDILDDLYVHHMPTSDEIFMAAKELETFLPNTIPPYSSLQKKIFCSDQGLLFYNNLSRISDFYLSNHKYFFEIKK